MCKWLETSSKNAKNHIMCLKRIKKAYSELKLLFGSCLIKIPNVGYCRLIDLIPWLKYRYSIGNGKKPVCKKLKVISCALNSSKSVFRVETSFWELSHKNTVCSLLSSN